MSNLPPHLIAPKIQKSVCLILEGYEEDCYFKRLQTLSVFSRIYNMKMINAKGANNIPARYQAALASDSYEVVLIVCDMDRIPDKYNDILRGIKNILGNENAEKITTFTRPCTLQIILSHFGDVTLTTQSKASARADVERLTGVVHYDAHKGQLDEVCQKIFRKSWESLIGRLEQLSDNPDDIPSSNMGALFEKLCSDDFGWIEDINTAVLKGDTRKSG